MLNASCIFFYLFGLLLFFGSENSVEKSNRSERSFWFVHVISPPVLFYVLQFFIALALRVLHFLFVRWRCDKVISLTSHVIVCDTNCEITNIKRARNFRPRRPQTNGNMSFSQFLGVLMQTNTPHSPCDA